MRVCALLVVALLTGCAQPTVRSTVLLPASGACEINGGAIPECPNIWIEHRGFTDEGAMARLDPELD